MCCCRSEVYPLDKDIAATMLAIGQFNQVGESVWQRVIEEEATTVTATYYDADNCLTLTLHPAISVAAHHHDKIHAAGVYFEIMAKYAEKVGGEIYQRANVMGCKVEDSPNGLLLASYPAMPMSFDRVCQGFQAAFLEPLMGEKE